MPNTHTKEISCRETGCDTIITHSMLTELHFYTSLAFCLLPSFPSTMISLYTSEVMHLTLNLSTLHNLSAGKKYHLKILLQGWGAGSVGVSSAVTFAQRTTAATLCRQPDLCPCWEIPQHSWKRCHCDWELCFGTPKAWKKTPWHSFPNSTGSLLMEIKVRQQGMRYLLAMNSECTGVFLHFYLSWLLAQMIIRHKVMPDTRLFLLRCSCRLPGEIPNAWCHKENKHVWSVTDVMLIHCTEC